jgi:AAA domain
VSARARVTIGDLADRFGLPVEFFRFIGVREVQGAVLVPYRDEQGGELFAKRWVRSAGADKCGRMPRGQKVTPYGLDRLAALRAEDRPTITLTDSETDAWCLWARGFPALAVPGVQAIGTIMPEHVRGIRCIYLCQRADEAGVKFAAAVTERLRVVGYEGEPVRVVTMPDGLKDPGELHAQDPPRFAERYRAACKAAELAAWRSTFRSLAEILADPAVLDPPQTVVPHLAWRGRLTLLAGREKDGKSTLASAAAAAVSRGAAFLEGPTLPGNVVYLALEEHLSDVAGRLHRFDADPARVFIAGHDLDRSSADLERGTAEHKPVLVIVDTLAAFVGGDIEDAGSSAAWTPLMARFVRIARDHEVAVLLLHHARKSDGTYRDSTAIGAAVDALIELRPDQDNLNVRRLRARARFPISDTSIELAENGYRLTAAGLTLERRVLAFVEATPGCSSGALVRAVAGRDSDVLAMVRSLVDRGELVQVGTGKRHALRIADSQPAPTSGQHRGQRLGAAVLPAQIQVGNEQATVGNASGNAGVAPIQTRGGRRGQRSARRVAPR